MYYHLQGWIPIAQQKTISGALDSEKGNRLKTINLQTRIIDWSYAWHWDYSNHNEFWRDFPVEVRRNYNAISSTAVHCCSHQSNSQRLTKIPFSNWFLFTGKGMCAAVTHITTQTKGHEADCLLSTSENLATWILLTFNRGHYGGLYIHPATA